MKLRYLAACGFVAVAVAFFKSSMPYSINVEPVIAPVKSFERKVDRKTQAKAQTENSRAPAAETKSDFDAEIINVENNIERLNACYDQANCDFPETDPHSYEFSIGRALESEAIRLQAIAGQIQDERISEIARGLMSNTDGFVKEGALNLIRTQPASENNLDAILNEIIGHYDAELVRIALIELARYTRPDEQEKINAALGNAMLTGAPFVAEEISVNINPFITDLSYPTYKDLAVKLFSGSEVRTNLVASLQRFERSHGLAN